MKTYQKREDFLKKEIGPGRVGVSVSPDYSAWEHHKLVIRATPTILKMLPMEIGDTVNFEALRISGIFLGLNLKNEKFSLHFKQLKTGESKFVYLGRFLNKMKGLDVTRSE